MNRGKWFGAVFMVVMILAACSSGGQAEAPVYEYSSIDRQAESAFLKLVSVDDLNSRLAVHFLEDPILVNTFKINAPIQIEIFNQSDDTIMFNYNEDIHIYLYKNGEWVEHPNTIGVKPGEKYLEAGASNFYSVGPRFDMSNENSTSKTLIIFVEGQIVKDGVKTKDKAAAYLGVVLEP